jgi:hypothetical protein
MIKDRSQSFPMADEPGKRCVILDAWEQECIAPGAISKCHAERDRRVKFRAALDELKAEKAIVADGHDGTRVYPSPKGERDEARRSQA